MEFHLGFHAGKTLSEIPVPIIHFLEILDILGNMLFRRDQMVCEIPVPIKRVFFKIVDFTSLN